MTHTPPPPPQPTSSDLSSAHAALTPHVTALCRVLKSSSSVQQGGQAAAAAAAVADVTCAWAAWVQSKGLGPAALSPMALCLVEGSSVHAQALGERVWKQQQHRRQQPQQDAFDALAASANEWRSTVVIDSLMQQQAGAERAHSSLLLNQRPSAQQPALDGPPVQVHYVACV